MKTVKYILVAFVLFFSAPAAANVVSDSSVVSETDARIKQLTQRLTEVKATDRSVLSGGVYVSVGALILILILLIILL
jgi:hypothetical protein